MQMHPSTSALILLSPCVPVQVILDTSPPTVTDTKILVTPTAETPEFQLQVTFSEPVSWLANSSSAAAATGGGAGSGTATSIAASYSSSRILMQNAAVLNISMVAGTGAVLADGSPTNAGSTFLLWFRSLSGAQAQVQIQGAAYQDIAGNKGQQDTTVGVSDAAFHVCEIFGSDEQLASSLL